MKHELAGRYPLLITWLSALWNLFYGLFQLFLGISQDSFWYITLAAFFLAIGLGRLMVSMNRWSERLAMKLQGILILFLSVVICGITYLTINESINPVRNKVLVIGQAAFAFAMVSTAIYNMIVSYIRKENRNIMIRNLSLASAFGSILSLERTMLGTFGVPGDAFNMKMEAGSGWFVFTILVVMAYNMIRIANK